MAKYVFPALFEKEENGFYAISFPDVPGCYTGGATLAEAISMAEDALCLMLYDREEDGEPIPVPTDMLAIPVQENAFVNLIACDTVEYRKFYDNRAIKKTLTIPNWLNTLADREGLNFSQVLQEGLKGRLGIQ